MKIKNSKSILIWKILALNISTGIFMWLFNDQLKEWILGARLLSLSITIYLILNFFQSRIILEEFNDYLLLNSSVFLKKIKIPKSSIANVEVETKAIEVRDLEKWMNPKQYRLNYFFHGNRIKLYNVDLIKLFEVYEEFDPRSFKNYKLSS